MKYTLVDREEVASRPAPPRGRRVEEMNSLVNALVPGKVARIEPGENERMGGLRGQIYRAAVRLGKQVEVWDDGNVLYAELTSA